MRVPNISSQRSRPQPSSSGYSFTANRQSSTVPSSFNFTQNKYQLNSREDPEVQFISKRQMPKPRQVPELVPIARSIPSQNGLKPNGFGNFSQSQNRRSMLDFTNRNRVSLCDGNGEINLNKYSRFQAFNDSSTHKPNQSILDRNHNLEVKKKYDSLLKSLIPRFAQKGKSLWNFFSLCLNRLRAIVILAYQQPNEVFVKRRDEPIQTVDLSSDETETSAGGAESSHQNRYPLQYRSNAFEFKKPSAFVDLSDDEDSDPFISTAPVSSTIIQNKKSEGVSRTSSFRKNESMTSVVVPDVKPVNSLAEKQQSRNCLKEDVISTIVRKFQESQRKNDSQINDVSLTWVELEVAEISSINCWFIAASQSCHSKQRNKRSGSSVASTSPSQVSSKASFLTKKKKSSMNSRNSLTNSCRSFVSVCMDREMKWVAFECKLWLSSLISTSSFRSSFRSLIWTLRDTISTPSMA